MCFDFVVRINLRPAKDYRYLNQSDCLEIGNVDDAARFRGMLVRFLNVWIITLNWPILYAIYLSFLWK